MKVFSKYSLIARVFPTVLGLVPLFVFQYVFLKNSASVTLLIVSAVGNLSLSTILLYAFNQYIIRIPSKLFEEWLFSNQLHFPTTNFLMYSDHEYTEIFKDRIRDAINKDFSIQLSGKSEERKDPLAARKRIKEVTRLIIGKVQDGYLVLQHNTEYGFVRNLWGASLVGIAGSSLILLLTGPESLLRLVAVILFFGYLLYLAFGFLVIKYFGCAYARKLIEEYYKMSYGN